MFASSSLYFTKYYKAWGSEWDNLCVSVRNLESGLLAAWTTKLGNWEGTIENNHGSWNVSLIVIGNFNLFQNKATLDFGMALGIT